LSVLTSTTPPIFLPYSAGMPAVIDLGAIRLRGFDPSPKHGERLSRERNSVHNQIAFDIPARVGVRNPHAFMPEVVYIPSCMERPGPARIIDSSSSKTSHLIDRTCAVRIDQCAGRRTPLQRFGNPTSLSQWCDPRETLADFQPAQNPRQILAPGSGPGRFNRQAPGIQGALIVRSECSAILVAPG